MKSNIFVLFLVIFYSSISQTGYCQFSEKYTAGDSNMQYDVNLDNDIDENYEIFPLKTGELIVVSTSGYRLNLFKYDQDLNLIKEQNIHIYESADIKGTVVESRDFAHKLGDKIFIKIKYSPLGTKDQFELFQIFDFNLEAISKWQEFGETSKKPTNQIAITDRNEERKRLAKLGRLRFNEERIVSISLDKENIYAHELKAFKTDGALAYEKTVAFDNSNEDLHISSIELLEDGSLIYIYQHIGKGIYFKLLDPQGELLEGEFPLPEKFVLLENLSNPEEIDQFVLFGLDKDAKPRLFLYSFSGINETEIHEFDLPTIGEQYISNWELKINDNQDLYFSGITWEGSFEKGYETRKNLNYFVSRFNLKDVTDKAESWLVNFEDNPFKNEKVNKTDIGIDIHSKISFLFEDDGDLYFQLKNFNVQYFNSPYSSFTYDRSEYRTLKINIEDETALLFKFNLKGYFNNDDAIVRHQLAKQKKGDYKYHLRKMTFENNKIETLKEVKLSHKFSKKQRYSVYSMEMESGKSITYVYNSHTDGKGVVIARIEF